SLPRSFLPRGVHYLFSLLMLFHLEMFVFLKIKKAKNYVTVIGITFEDMNLFDHGVLLTGETISFEQGMLVNIYYFYILPYLKVLINILSFYSKLVHSLLALNRVRFFLLSSTFLTPLFSYSFSSCVCVYLRGLRTYITMKA
ncbi:hypothetical protein L9F63_008233, partial [Diploptera punctata]